jgi:hypothetical protein
VIDVITKVANKASAESCQPKRRGDVAVEFAGAVNDRTVFGDVRSALFETKLASGGGHMDGDRHPHRLKSRWHEAVTCG